jgi:hypothetical protein
MHITLQESHVQLPPHSSKYKTNLSQQLDGCCMIHDNLQTSNNVDTRYLMLHALYVMESACAIQRLNLWLLSNIRT